MTPGPTAVQFAISCGLSKEACLTPKKEFEQALKRGIEARLREGAKTVLEEVLEEEMTEHLEG